VTEKEKETETEESSTEEEVVQRIGKVKQWPGTRRRKADRKERKI
jgi:hypothetical protein